MDHGSFNPTLMITPLIAMTMLLERKLKEGLIPGPRTSRFFVHQIIYCTDAHRDIDKKFKNGFPLSHQSPFQSPTQPVSALFLA